MVLSSRFTELICDDKDMSWSTPTTSRSSSCSATCGQLGGCWWSPSVCMHRTLDPPLGFITLCRFLKRIDSFLCSAQNRHKVMNLEKLSLVLLVTVVSERAVKWWGSVEWGSLSMCIGREAETTLENWTSILSHLHRLIEAVVLQHSSKGTQQSDLILSAASSSSSVERSQWQLVLAHLVRIGWLNSANYPLSTNNTSQHNA